jgi:hypothetical protein
LSEPSLRTELSTRTSIARQPFEMNRCLAAYESLFASLSGMRLHLDSHLTSSHPQKAEALPPH